MPITTDPQTALRLADKSLARLHPARDEAAYVAACYRRTADAPTPTDTGNGRVVVLHGRVQRVR